MDSQESNLALSGDVPKSDPQDDALGYDNFAKRLSVTISNISSSNGMVIGLCGPWGSGKTTALNFAKAYLEEYNRGLQDERARVTIIDFEPWLFSGRKDLITAFFQVLAERLPKERHSTKVSRSLFRFARRNSDSLSSLVAAVGMTVDPTGGVVSTAATNMGKRGVEASLDQWLETPSLQTTYTLLVKRLLDEKRRILIVIDDIDRLSVDEIRTMMQMVKSVGKLPYVTYLLAYDREHVSAALEAPGYVKKIIQQELFLPQPTGSTLLSMLNENARFIFSKIPQTDRWYVVANHIGRWLQNPRDVERYSNVLKFAWPAFENEIDPVDILAIEG